MTNILSIDVEDWFHILDLEFVPTLAQWDELESRVERNMHFMLEELDRSGVKATCFFLGWVADKFPRLVKLTAQCGHEIASHGYSHQLIYTQTRKQFADDIRKAKDLLEQITGEAVLGYRAPGFSIIKETPWAVEELRAAGFSYDSSIFPGLRGHGGLIDAVIDPHVIRTAAGSMIEFPISVVQILGKRVCLFGGGYLRVFPYFLINHMSRTLNRAGRPVVYYIHPREVDPNHPRLPMGWARSFKSYVNLSTTLPKLRALMKDQELTTFKEWLRVNGSVLEKTCAA